MYAFDTTISSAVEARRVELGCVAPQPPGGSRRLERRHVTRRRQHHVRLAALVVARPPATAARRYTPVVFAFHGYQRAIHEIAHGRPSAARFHVRGFNEQGTTTTPFDMVVLNGMSRYHLCIEALRRTSRMGDRAATLIADCRAAIDEAAVYARGHFEDPPEIRDWVWTS